MKKIIVFFSFILTWNLALFSQDTVRVGLNKYLVGELLKREFANLISPQSENNLGNFASFDSKDSELNFAGNIIFKKGSVLGIKAKGSSSDGILSIFSNSKFNSQIGMDFQFNLLRLKDNLLYYDNSSYHAYIKNKKRIEQEYIIKSEQIEQRKDSLLFLSEIIKLETEKEKVLLEINEVQLKYDSIIIVSKIQELKLISKKLNKQISDEPNRFKKDSLECELSKCNKFTEFKENRLKNYRDYNSLKKDSLALYLSELEKKIGFIKEEINNLPSKVRLLFELDDWRAEEFRKLQKNLKIYGFNMRWFSFGYGLSNNSFNHFDPAQVIDDQIQKKSYLNHQLRIQYSFYRLSPFSFESYYWSLGISFSIEDNLSELTSIELNEREDYGTNPDERYTINKYNAYIGEYKTNLKTLRLYGDFYYFLFEENKAAIHFYPELKSKDEYNPLLNLGFGFLISFKGKNKNIVNTELYYNLIDVGDANEYEYSLLKRSNLGIRFTFPIQFNSKTK
ncbi:hypothetical protein ES705_29467 [subsurface metagenome]